MWQDAVPDGIGVGAPPDDFNLGGQDWGVAPFDPWRLRALSYEPFIQTVRAALRFGGGLRYDHVMGLFRLFWIPSGAGAAEGTYVRYPAGDLLDILALESRRWGAFVVGEDLGTVEPGVREELAARNILSYRLLWFEPSHPAEYPELALAAVTNHDIPTIPGLWTGADFEQQASAGMEPNRGLADSMRARISELASVPATAGVEEAVEAAYRLLGAAPSAVVIATMEDALGVLERPNLPGTSTGVPNWTSALPMPLEEIFALPEPQKLAEILSPGRKRTPG
jgi:4-alpha-glucanotransferase